MIYVKARWIVGTIGWLVQNATGEYHWTQRDDHTLWRFEKSEDAVAFRLRFGL